MVHKGGKLGKTVPAVKEKLHSHINGHSELREGIEKISKEKPTKK